MAWIKSEGGALKELYSISLFIELFSNTFLKHCQGMFILVDLKNLWQKCGHFCSGMQFVYTVYRCAIIHFFFVYCLDCLINKTHSKMKTSELAYLPHTFAVKMALVKRDFVCTICRVWSYQSQTLIFSPCSKSRECAAAGSANMALAAKLRWSNMTLNGVMLVYTVTHGGSRERREGSGVKPLSECVRMFQGLLLVNTGFFIQPV